MNARQFSSKHKDQASRSQRGGVRRGSRPRQMGELLHRRRVVQASTPRRFGNPTEASIVDPRVEAMLRWREAQAHTGRGVLPITPRATPVCRNGD